MKRGEPLAALLAQLRAAEKTGDLASPALAWSAVQQGALAWREADPKWREHAITVAMRATDAIRELVIAGDVEALRALDAKARKAVAARQKARRFAPKSTDGGVLVKMVRGMVDRRATSEAIAQAIVARCSNLPAFRGRFEVLERGQRAGVSEEQEKAAARAIERDRDYDRDAATIVRHALLKLGFSRDLARTASGDRK